MHLLILGGSPHHLGGVEAFCDRSTNALTMRNADWQIARIPTSTAYLSFRKLPRLIGGLARLVRYRFKRPDCVWLQYSNLPDLAYLAVAKLMGMRVMVTPHLGSNWRSQSKPMLRSISGWLLSFADRLALISKTQELEINLPVQVPRSYIRNFLPPAVLSSVATTKEDAPAAIQLIHSGRLSEGKGTFLVVEVCAQLKSAGLPFFCRITGGADDETFVRLHALIAKFGLGDEVKVHGRVSDKELLDLLRGSDVLIHLSRIDSYPLIVLEALACSMLPVCMDLAGARDMVQTYDGKVVSETAAVSETAEFLMKSDLADVRHRGSIEAVRVQADYSWDLCGQAVDAALRVCSDTDGVFTTHPSES